MLVGSSNVSRCTSNLAWVPCLLVLWSSQARGGTADDGERAPLPEPILTETVTDIDGVDANELEIELNANAFRARRGGARRLRGSVEVEYRATRWLGLLIEPGWAVDGTGRGLDAGRFELSAGLAVPVLQNPARQMYAQLEVTGRAPLSVDELPGESAFPVSLFLRTAMRAGPFTLRPGVGVETGHPTTVAAVRGAFAILAPIVPDPRFGFFGLELDADGGRISPYSVAVNLVADCTPLGVPLRLGMAIPWTLSADAGAMPVGVHFRAYYVSDRERAPGRPSPARPQ